MNVGACVFSNLARLEMEVESNGEALINFVVVQVLLQELLVVLPFPTMTLAEIWFVYIALCVCRP